MLVDKVAVDKLYHVSVTFDVPGTRIATKDQSEAVASHRQSAVFAELDRQLEEYLANGAPPQVASPRIDETRVVVVQRVATYRALLYIEK